MTPMIETTAHCSSSGGTLSPQVFRAAVFYYLVHECLNLYVDTMKDIERVWGLEEEEVFRLGICSCPSQVNNLIAASACAERFGELTRLPGFYLCDGCWWLDIDANLSCRGLFVPVRDSRLWIVGLRVFRNVRDERPFMLRVRAQT